jgi:hypothetical protein
MHKDRPLSIALALVLAVSAGCASIGQKTTTASNQEPKIPKSETPGLVAFTDLCPIQHPGDYKEAVPVIVGALAIAAVTTFVPVVFDLVVGAASDALERRAEALSASTTAKGAAEIWKIQGGGDIRPAIRCLVFIRGVFTQASEQASEEENENDYKGVDPNVWDAAATKNVNSTLSRGDVTARLKGVPEMYAEFPIRYPTVSIPAQTLKNAEGKDLLDEKKVPVKLSKATSLPVAMEIGPPLVVYVKPGPRREKPEEQLVLALTLTADMMNQNKREEVTLVDRPFDLEKLRWPVRVPRERYVTWQPIRFRLPSPFPEKVEVLSETGANGYASALNLVRLTGTAVLTETQEGGDIERAVAKAARENRAKFSDPVVKFLEDLIKKNTAKEAAAK